MTDLLGEPLVLAFAAAFVLLASATGAARLLVLRAGETPTLVNLSERVRSWWIIVAILAAAFAAGPAATILLFALVSFWCLREFLSLTPTPVADHYAIAASFYLFLPLQYLLLWEDWLGLFFIAVPVYGFLTLPVLAVLQGETVGFLQRAAKVQWALMLAVYCLSHMPALLLLQIPGYAVGGFGLIAFLLIVVQGNDVLQYVFGKLAGRTPLAPSVSPRKTREGAILGIAAATLLAGAIHGLTPFGLAGALAMGLVLALAGTLGGLVLSAVKRSLGAKDWGTMVEGHGGMLDRMDSLAFTAPLFFHLSRYFYSA